MNTHTFILCLLVAFAWIGCKDSKVRIKPTYQPMTESVYASVTVQPENLYAAYATTTGILEKVTVEEGDAVTAGQLLAVIDAENPNINLANAELTRDLARENYRGGSSMLDNIQAELEAAQLQLQVDSSNYERQRNLWNKDIGSKTELDAKRLRFELAENKLVNLRRRYTQTQRELATNYRQSQNSVKSAKTNVKDFSIRANISGMVYTRYKEEGELISPQQAFAEIGSADQFLLELRIDETDIAQVDTGQQVIVTLDAYPKESFGAKLTRIYPQKDARTQTFRAEALFDIPPKKLFPGLTGEANIIQQQKDKTLTIPTTYLNASNRVVTAAGEIDVKVGLRGLDVVEILGGIDTSTVLLKPE